MDVVNEHIYRWIDTYKISRQKKLINRDFSDAVPLAEILKHHYPRLVELHNYAPKNSFQNKLENWSTLQRKVLSKLNINLSKDTLEELANSEPGVIEKVLVKVKERVDRQSCRNSESSLVSCSKDNLDFIIQKKKRKYVPVDIVEEILKNLEEKDQEIEALNEKVNTLQHVVKDKEITIEDLKLEVSNCNLRSESGVFYKIMHRIF